MPTRYPSDLTRAALSPALTAAAGNTLRAWPATNNDHHGCQSSRRGSRSRTSPRLLTCWMGRAPTRLHRALTAPRLRSTISSRPLDQRPLTAAPCPGPLFPRRIPTPRRRPLLLPLPPLSPHLSLLHLSLLHPRRMHRGLINLPPSSRSLLSPSRLSSRSRPLSRSRLLSPSRPRRLLRPRRWCRSLSRSLSRPRWLRHTSLPTCSLPTCSPRTCLRGRPGKRTNPLRRRLSRLRQYAARTSALRGHEQEPSSLRSPRLRPLMRGGSIARRRLLSRGSFPK